uniref:EMAP like 4 n=1 Tax=Cyprinus carpio TaxID=7962 RepID=A0A8C1VPV0_CYPCA
MSLINGKYEKVIFISLSLADDSISAASTSDVQDRLSSLELRVQQQEDELTVMKAALADVLRRLAQSEDSAAAAKKQQSSKGNLALPCVCLLYSKKIFLSSNFSTEGEYIKMFMRGRPITMFIPSDVENYDDVRTELPPERLKLEWVYGYRGRDCRANVYLLPTGEIVYFIASVVVLFNYEERTQRHYLGHTDCVKCLAVHPDKIRIATGQIAGVDKDGRPHVRVWDSVSLSTLQIIGLGTFERGVGSLAFSKADSGIHLSVIDDSNEHMLTVWDWQKKSKIAEIKTTNEVVLVVEFHPTDANTIVTCGKSHIFFWTWSGSSLARKQGIFGVRTPMLIFLIGEYIKKNEHGHCADFHPSGSVVAIGTHSGKWYALDAETRDLVAIHTDGNEQLSLMRYSVDGALLAVGSHDNFIYLYTVSDKGRKYSRYGKCTGHSSYITHLDWSPDNKFIMSNSGDYEILYWDIPNGCKLIRNRSECKDIDWATYTCVLGYHVFGVWPEGSDGTDINALVRSHNRKVIALADDFCKVHLFQYPCSRPKAPSHKYSAHSSHVTNVSFMHRDSHLISTGGKDTSIMQWRLVEKTSSLVHSDSSLGLGDSLLHNSTPRTLPSVPSVPHTPTEPLPVPASLPLSTQPDTNTPPPTPPEPVHTVTPNGQQDDSPETPPPSDEATPPSDSTLSPKDSLEPSDDTATPSDEGTTFNPPL